MRENSIPCSPSHGPPRARPRNSTTSRKTRTKPATSPPNRPELLAKTPRTLNGHLIATKDLGLLPESTMHEFSRKHGITPGDFARSAHFAPAALIPVHHRRHSAGLPAAAADNPQVLAVQLRALVVHACRID
jgi:hypothetical protein